MPRTTIDRGRFVKILTNRRNLPITRGRQVAAVKVKANKRSNLEIVGAKASDMPCTESQGATMKLTKLPNRVERN